MTTTDAWKIVEPDLETALSRYAHPLEDLANGAIPAIVIREAFAPEECSRLVDRLIEDEYLYDPRKPIPDSFQEETIPEGYYREGRSSLPAYAWQSKTGSGRNRIDIGTSLGYRGSDKEEFLDHSAHSHEIFAKIFSGWPNPIEVIYENLARLSRGKRVVTAHEPDGRMYSPAIIRAHYGGYAYKPHFDSVRLREKRSDYAVFDFEHQFAGVLVLQNTQLGDQTAQGILHQCLWNEQVDPYLKSGRFPEYASENNISSVEVCLNPGDLYYFNTRGIHEVPGLAGELPRIVLATFIGYSTDKPEIFVWS